MRATTLVATVVCLTRVASAQEPRVVPLPGSAQRLQHGFTVVSAVHELVDGRVVVVDAREREVVVGDFRAQRVSPIGRRGAGPREYAQPRGAFALPNGHTLVQDPGNARFLELDSDGRAIGPWQPAGATGRSQSLALSVSWDVRAVDAKGRVYFEQLPGPLKPGTSATVPIVRADPASSRIDTIARYMLTSEMQTLATVSTGASTLMVRPRAWPARPEWNVSTGGDVALIGASPYRVTWYRTTGAVTGPPLAVAAWRPTDDDRAAFTEATTREVRGPSSPGSRAPRPAGAPAPIMKRGGTPLFPDALPPFSGRGAVRVAPDGRVWVSRLQHVTDSVQVIDVFGADGRLEQRVSLPPHCRLAGFSVTATYLVYRDENDLEFLERYPRAASAR